MQLLVHIWRNRETNGKQQHNLTRMAVCMETHFQLPPYEFHWATRQARDIAISANSLGTWFFSKEKLCGRTQRLLEIIPYRTEYRGGWLPACALHSIRLICSFLLVLCLYSRSSQSLIMFGSCFHYVFAYRLRWNKRITHRSPFLPSNRRLHLKKVTDDLSELAS